MRDVVLRVLLSPTYHVYFFFIFSFLFFFLSFFRPVRRNGGGLGARVIGEGGLREGVKGNMILKQKKMESTTRTCVV